MKTLLPLLFLAACINDPRSTPDPEPGPFDQQVADQAQDGAPPDARPIEDANGLLRDISLPDTSPPDAALPDAALPDAAPPMDDNWQIVAEMNLPGPPLDLDIVANQLYATLDLRGIAVIRIADPLQPEFSGFVPVLAPNALAMHPSGAWGVVAAVGDGVRVIDFRNAEQPIEIGAFDLVGAAGAEYAQDIALVNQTAYVAAGSQGVWRVDVSDPTRPRGAGHCCGVDGHPLSGPRSIDVFERSALVADTVEGLSVVSFSGDAPVRMAGLAMPGEARVVRRFGNRAYVLVDDNTLVTVLSRQPGALEVENTVAIPAPTTHLTVAEGRLLMGTSNGVWHLEDGVPVQLLDLNGRPATSILVNGPWMYIATERGVIIARRGG